MITALVFLLILMTAVLVHELAHYLNARSVGIPVRAFSIGMGPVIFQRHWRGTNWRVSLFPVGGYVDLPGMAPKVDESGVLHHPDEGMALKTLPQKIWVLIGGVIANFLLGTGLIAAVVMLEPSYRQLVAGVVPDESGAVIAGIVPASNAEALGLEAGDEILAINEWQLPDRNRVTSTIQTTNGRLRLVVLRNGERLTFESDWPPADSAGKPFLGIQIAPKNIEDLGVPFAQAVRESLVFGVRIIPEMIQGFVRGFGSALVGRRNEDVAGPVGIISAVNQAARIGVVPVLFLAAIINFSLAVFNLLPIPGLDGGRILLASVIAVRGKPFKPGQEEAIHFIGIMAVLALIVLITFNELSNLIRG